MQFFVIAALAASALAVPAEIAPRHCNGGALYSVSQCCSTNVLNVAALDCQADGPGCEVKQDFCCSIPIAGQALLCTKA